MSVYVKLQKCRVELQNCSLKKSGNNKFAGYQYFELGDFLPKINELLLENKLCSFIQFDNELAKLTIIDTEDNSTVEFTSPMSSASLKGCHDIQNLGAIQTYLRRYLYQNAFEIVEHDAIDASPHKEEPKANKLQQMLQEIADLAKVKKIDIKAELPKLTGKTKSSECNEADCKKVLDFLKAA